MTGDSHWSPLEVACAVALAGSSFAGHAQVMDVEYADDRVYTVKTGLGLTTSIELDPEEQVLDYSTGFSTGWDLTRRENVFYLKPRDVDVDTNLLVRTDRHAYIFELHVVATDWTSLADAKRAGVQYRVRLRYPPAAAAEARLAAAGLASALADAGIASPGDAGLHVDYEFATRARDRGLVPLNVHDDGRFTYIRMQAATTFPSGRFPAVFARQSENDEDFVVNTTVEEDTIVVHGTYPFLVMRHGDDVVGLRRVGP